jgi:hypothetical protein
LAVPADAIGKTPMPKRSQSFVVPSSAGRRIRNVSRIAAATNAVPIEIHAIQLTMLHTTRLA